MNELMKKYNIINEKINKLEGENEILKQQNKYLLDFINENNNNNELYNNNILIKENNILNNFNSNNDMIFSNSQQSNNKLIDGEMSIFNNSNNEINNKPNFNYYNKETNNSNVTDLSALTQMNFNLTHNQNSTSDRRKRFLIPKSE